VLAISHPYLPALKVTTFYRRLNDGAWDIPAGRRRDWDRPATPIPVVREAAYILPVMSGLVDQLTAGYEI
jgi:hypothetical protein